MTYEPLHHKYRPQTFAELVGQEAIATTLTNAIRQQKIAPAYLFTGARGTGKTSSARILAKSLNCLRESVPTETPCGQCDVCQTIARGTALDVIEIDAASNTGVDNIRELIERAQFAPVQCRYKVYVLDEVHMLSSSSFAALLKTLEEPPDRVVFVLATTDPQRVLPTIISRCQRFDFRRIELQAMVRHLTTIAQKEAIDITAEALELVAQIAQGGLRDAESLLDQLSLLSGTVTIDRVWDLVGAVPERDLLALAEAIAQTDPIAVLEHTRRLLNYGREPLMVLQNLVSFYRDLMIAKTAPDRKDLVAVTAPTWAQMQQLAQPLELQTILLAQTHLRSSEGQLRHSTQPRLWLEVILSGLLTQNVATPMAVHQVQVSQPTAQTSPPIATKPVQPTAPVTPPVATPEVKPTPPQTAPPEVRPVESQPADVQTPPPAEKQQPPQVPAHQPGAAAHQIELLQTWLKVLERVPPLTKGLVKEHGHLLAVTSNDVRVGFPTNLMKPAQKQVERLEKAFTEVLGRTIKVKLEIYVPEEVEPAGGQSSISPPTPAPATQQVPPAPPVKRADSAAPPPATPAPPVAPTPIDPIVPTIPIPSWEEDEVTRAAKSLAMLFNGQVVDLEGDFMPSFSSELNGAAALPIDDEDDTPF